MKTLNLTLTKKWFDMIASGEKTEEYREIKSYWIKRLLSFNDYQEFSAIEQMCIEFKGYPEKQSETLSWFDASFKKFNKVRFKNGYAKDAPTMGVRCKGIYVNRGVSQWGAEGINVYFVIELGEILSISNYKN